MVLNNIKEVKDFENAIIKAKGSVWLEIRQIGKEEPILNVDMKSSLSRYVAFGKIVEESIYDGFDYYFEIFCQYPEDEPLFYEFFRKFPDTLSKCEKK